MRLVLPIAIGVVAAIGGSVASPARPAAAAAPSWISLSGDVPHALYPGARAEPVQLTLRNRTDAEVRVTRVAMTVRATGAPGCRSDWFRTSRVAVPPGGIPVPARGSVTLPAAGVAAPTIRMIDSGTAQDVCQHAKVTLAYSARARQASTTNSAASSGGPPANAPGNGSANAPASAPGQLPFTGFELALAAALGLVLLVSGVALRRTARPRGDR